MRKRRDGQDTNVEIRADESERRIGKNPYKIIPYKNGMAPQNKMSDGVNQMLKFGVGSDICKDF